MKYVEILILLQYGDAFMSQNMCIHHLGLLMLCCGLGNKLVLM